MANHKLVKFDVLHARHTPKKYSFRHKFFWFKIDLTDSNNFPSRLVGYNKTRLYSFFDSDHMKLGGTSAKDNFVKFAKKNGFNGEVKNISIYTQLRFLGYVFNPVSFVLITDAHNKQHAIIEIGNTFNELKPFFVHNDHFDDKGFVYTTIKHFYISPFIAHDNYMTFKFIKKENDIRISIDDYKEDDKTLTVAFKGQEIEASTKNLLILTASIPFVTFKIIGLIHYHALVLWLKGIKFYKKTEHTELQKGMMTWKTSKDR